MGFSQLSRWLMLGVDFSTPFLYSSLSYHGWFDSTTACVSHICSTSLPPPPPSHALAMPCPAFLPTTSKWLALPGSLSLCVCGSVHRSRERSVPHPVRYTWVTVPLSLNCVTISTSFLCARGTNAAATDVHPTACPLHPNAHRTHSAVRLVAAVPATPRPVPSHCSSLIGRTYYTCPRRPRVRTYRYVQRPSEDEYVYVHVLEYVPEHYVLV
jgi:hypothetical protein